MISIYHTVSLEIMNKHKLKWKLKNIVKLKVPLNLENMKLPYNIY